MNTPKLIQLGRTTALMAFLIGTLIFGLYYLTSSAPLLMLGYLYLVLAGLVNLIILILILFRASEDKANRKQLLSTSGWMLLNIPVAGLYIWFSLILLNTMRITIVNSTRSVLSDINIIGCDEAHIDQLKVGEQKTIWLKIERDCAINMEYLADGIQMEETVEGYVTSDMGGKRTYYIGGEN